MNQPNITPLAEAAAAHKVNPATVRKWLQRGKLTRHGYDDQGRALVDADELGRVVSPPPTASSSVPLTSPWSPADNANDRLLDVSDAARIMGVKPATIRTWARRGYIGLDGTRQRLRLRGIDERGRRYYSWFDVAKAERATRDRAGRHFPRLTEDTEIF